MKLDRDRIRRVVLTYGTYNPAHNMWNAKKFFMEEYGIHGDGPKLTVFEKHPRKAGGMYSVQHREITIWTSSKPDTGRWTNVYIMLHELVHWWMDVCCRDYWQKNDTNYYRGIDLKPFGESNFDAPDEKEANRLALKLYIRFMKSTQNGN